MPVTAAIKFMQGVTTDDPGRALIVVASTPVVMTNGDNTDVFDWTWEILTAPSASGIPTGVIAAGAMSSASSTADVPGSYLVRLTVKDTVGNQAQDTRAFIVLEGSRRLIPPFRGDFNSLNYGGQTEGWDPAMEQWLHATDGKPPLVNATTGSIVDIPSTDADTTSAEGIRFTNVVGPTVTGIASGYGGRRLYVMAAAAAIILADEDAGSAAANRIVTGTGGNVTLQFGSSAWLVYDGVDLRWRLTPISSGSAAPGAVADEIITTDGAGAYQVAPNVRALNTAIAVGTTTTASLGFWQQSNDGAGYARNFADTGDLCLWDSDGSDQLWLGTDRNGLNQHAAVNTYALTSVLFGIGANPVLELLAGTSESWQPITGSVVGSTPYGVHGESLFDMGDADYTASPNDYVAFDMTNINLTVMTADRTLKLPNATNARAYSKFVRNTNGGGFNVIVQDVAGGTTVTIADGFGAWVGIHAAGAYRKSADVAP